MDDNIKLAKTLAPTAWKFYQPMLDSASPHILLQLLPAIARLTLLMETVHNITPRAERTGGGRCSVVRLGVDCTE
jgi:hypothetical protein